jgi:phosphosulfolactate phosphohydrolase-like enzyme
MSEHSLRKIPLSVETKKEVAALINLSGFSGYRVQKETKINCRTAYRYASNSRDGKVMNERSGRPPILDIISRQTIANFLRDNPDASDQVLSSKMKEERKKTTSRRNPEMKERDLIQDVEATLSKQCIKRYIKLFRKELLNNS